ncbi:MAG: hypothetical protein U0610_05955 [bacterium]
MSRKVEPWTADERAVLRRLVTPRKIQEYLDALAYSDESDYRSPRDVLRDRRAHCMDGALFAAAALERLGHPPLLVDLRAVRDDDHVLAIFQVDGHLGAVAKSNTTTLRYREPIFRNLRELALSYFEFYYNVEYRKTLRSYSLPVDLRRFEAHGWRTDARAVDAIVDALDRREHRPLVTRAMIARLSRVDRDVYEAGFLGSNPAGLYRPAPRRSRAG